MQVVSVVAKLEDWLDFRFSENPTDVLTAWTRTARFLMLLFELVLVAAVVYLFNIEGPRHFFPVLCLIVGGFAIYTWLPTKYRLHFFALLSITCVLFVMGATNGLRVLAIGGALIGICYLPIAWRMRIGMLVVATAALVFARAQVPLPFWPVLGSMFMFRLFIFVHESRRAPTMPTLSSSVSYLFLLPNVCFPLFPVIDYRTFRNMWYDENEWEIYQRGVRWIVRGLVHLLLYRYIRTYVVPEPYQLYDVPHLALFMATNFSLYLHVSGQFHLITGLLHLFGFNLPRTPHLFFLASSFSAPVGKDFRKGHSCRGLCGSHGSADHGPCSTGPSACLRSIPGFEPVGG